MSAMEVVYGLAGIILGILLAVLLVPMLDYWLRKWGM